VPDHAGQIVSVILIWTGDLETTCVATRAGDFNVPGSANQETVVEEDLTTLILATGALGTAAFGIVEVIKNFAWFGDFGFRGLMVRLGAFDDLLRVAYGRDYQDHLRALYLTDHNEFAAALRQGIRIGLIEDNAKRAAGFVEVVTADDLKKAVAFQNALEVGKDSIDSKDADGFRRVLGRFDLAVDSRIDAALSNALRVYTLSMKLFAVGISLAIALGVGAYLDSQLENADRSLFFHAVLVGLAAVPVAPVTKDLVAAVGAATRAIRGRS
jgi:hypothetical protein